MAIYKIADLYVELETGVRTKNNAKPYLVKEYSGETDFKIIQNTEAAYKDLYPRWRTEANRDVADYIYECRQFYEKLLDYNGMMFHASAVVVDGKAYLFSAPSGTGKSTHTRLWLEYFGEKAYILNDDKPAIRIMDGKFYAYGTPWCGKDNVSTNQKCEIKAICFLERSEVN